MRRDSRSEKGARLVVVFIPTKELAFADVLARGGSELPRELMALVHREKRMWEQAREGLREQGIRWIEPLPALRGGPAAGSTSLGGRGE